MTYRFDEVDQLCVNTIRTLSMDAVQKAASGHPGAAMGMAPVVYGLWRSFLRYDPDDPSWINRDRFVLSAGHASMLLYSVLFLARVRQIGPDGRPTDRPAISLEEIRRFRQLHSSTAGHPEYGLASGIECTTGPLGQGAANSVGMAIAGRWLAEFYNRPGHELFGYDVYALAGDGCMMEGITSEAASMAGHLGLSNLCWIYDSNRISIEGSTDLAFTEDVRARFDAYGWNVDEVGDANDPEEFAHSLNARRETKDRPTLIIVHSHIGYGSPGRQDSASAHGEPLGEEEVRRTKKVYGWPEDSSFLVPEGVMERFGKTLAKRGRSARADWEALFASYRKEYPDLAAQVDMIRGGGLPYGWDGGVPVFPADLKGMATRAASGKVINALAGRIPWLLGGSADLAPSTKTLIDGGGDLSKEKPGGRNLRFGVREHAMGAIVNGLTLSGLRGYGATFLVFSDYMRPALRLSALMKIPAVQIFTHDSISLGEDGPTHQPVEHLPALRAIPNLLVLRPADANETAEAWKVALHQTCRPTALILTRQNVPTLDRTHLASSAGLTRGAYILADTDDGRPDALLLASGSEVSLVLEARAMLLAEGIRTRVVSMPSWELFEEQDAEYRALVLPSEVAARIAVEKAIPMGWERYVGPAGRVIGMAGFGASAPSGDLDMEFGFTAENVARVVRDLLCRTRPPCASG